MSRDEFLRELRSRISHLPAEELEAAMAYYNEYFDEAGEEAALRELGAPAEAAARIIADYEERNNALPVPKSANPVMRALSIPLGRTLLCIAGILLLILALLLCAGLLAIAVLSGNMMIAASKAMFVHIPTALFGFGAAITTIGVVILAAYGLFCGVKAVIHGIFLKKGA